MKRRVPQPCPPASRSVSFPRCCALLENELDELNELSPLPLSPLFRFFRLFRSPQSDGAQDAVFPGESGALDHRPVRVYLDAPNVAARVQALAEPGAVLVTAGVQRQVAGLFVVEERGGHQLIGVPGPVTLFRLMRASGGRRRAGQRHLTPLIGRDEEIATLKRRWDRTRQGDSQLVLMVFPGRKNHAYDFASGATAHLGCRGCRRQVGAGGAG